MWSLVSLFAVVAMSYSGPTPDPADILFKTNIQEMVDRPIVFDKPLPTWLKGTLVGIRIFLRSPFNCQKSLMGFVCQRSVYTRVFLKYFNMGLRWNRFKLKFLVF